MSTPAGIDFAVSVGEVVFAALGGAGQPVAAAGAGQRTPCPASGGSRVDGRRAVAGPQAAGRGCAPAPYSQAALAAAIAEAVRDRDERVLRRLLARFAEQAALADLPALRDALDTVGRHGDRPPGIR